MAPSRLYKLKSCHHESRLVFTISKTAYNVMRHKRLGYHQPSKTHLEKFTLSTDRCPVEMFNFPQQFVKFRIQCTQKLFWIFLDCSCSSFTWSIALIAVISGFNTDEAKGSFKPRLHVAVNKGGLPRGRNCDNSYLLMTVCSKRCHLPFWSVLHLCL